MEPQILISWEMRQAALWAEWYGYSPKFCHEVTVRIVRIEQKEARHKTMTKEIRDKFSFSGYHARQFL